ncbi:PSD1 and planctomycete cytochrome C domain-containing protein [Thalassoroseus pseudoceratinae]|uniref:PSD1 and planctomycete cytochrome C domain-containing protein n=1 Tax=Thalassoroseus pseudoceratinae TaxID=2713176 RepID=UPI0014231E70|nr:PSD1 and planctomycete cytochrome C domain-containing protein [Thalassoroseus pseudoceratinae]
MISPTLAQLSITLVLVFVAQSTAAEVDFNREVRPILSNKCFTCHGPDAETREAELRLDQRESVTGAAISGEQAIVPGDIASSELIRRITSDNDDERMPPGGVSKALTPAEIQTLKTWINQGAPYEAHWAFIPPRRPTRPPVRNANWPRNEIDYFVLARLEQRQTQPAKEASRETLIRRVAFDLNGLPPSLDEIDAFLSDSSPDAYERMVESYLDRPAYGEHMARHWLDLARYADSNGYQYDTERQQWVWRDWVIDAYNKNQPFDEFSIEQLAGDLLPNSTPQQRLATGFNRNHGITIEGGIIDEEYRTEYVMDRLVTTGQVWLGLTIGCARCHDHKYDPISQKEFYQLYAYFNQVPERGMRGFDPREQIPSPLAIEQHRQRDRQIAELKAKLEQPLDWRTHLDAWAKEVARESRKGWNVLAPMEMKSSGGTTLTKLDDDSVLASGANPRKDIYTITTQTVEQNITAVRLEALTHDTLPGGGPGRHSNSNFVLSEFELTAVSVEDPTRRQTVKFQKAIADYSQKNYEIGKSIDGTVAGNNGWAVDGPTRKEPTTALFIAEKPFGFPEGTQLEFRLRHEAGFATHGIGRPRFAITTDSPQSIGFDEIPAEIRRLAKVSPKTRTESQTQQLKAYFLTHHDPRNDLQERIAALEKQKAEGFPATMIMRELPQPRATHILNRGQYDQPTEKVSTGVPAILPPLPKDALTNRLGLARWLFHPKHPLTARVAVNRYWQRMFGLGLVKTSEDFGIQGELPSHPELLDWLALEFIRSGWDIKHMQRLIVMSATYRQSSHVGQAAYQTDPENRLLARGPRIRLDAEEIRDAALFASGLLVDRVGGKSVYPYQPKGLWLELNNRPGYSQAYPQGSGEDLYRRGLYTFWKRTAPSPMLKLLDAPEREFCTLQRSRTNTPLQALLLLNGPQFVEAARHLGERMRQHGGKTLEDQLRYGFRLVTSHSPTEMELQVLKEAYTADLKQFQRDHAAANRMLEVGESPVSNQADVAELAAFASTARLLLNLNEAITKG